MLVLFWCNFACSVVVTVINTDTELDGELLTIGDKKTTHLTFTPDKLFWVIPCVCVYEREAPGEFILNNLTMITLLKLFANCLGNVPSLMVSEHQDFHFLLQTPRTPEGSLEGF